MAHVPPYKGHWKERDGPSHVPASVVWQLKEGLHSRTPETIAHQTGRNQHWQERNGPSHVPAPVAWRFREGLNSRSPETIAHLSGRNRNWQERNGPCRVPASVVWRSKEGLNSRSPETIAHLSGRNRNWQERNGLCHVPASVVWRSKEGFNSWLPETIAPHSGRNRHWQERYGPYHVPRSVAGRFREGLNSRSPKIIAHQSGRNRHWQERYGPYRVPPSVAGRFREGLNSRSPKIIAHQSGRNRHWQERYGPYRVPPSFAGRFREGLNSRSPKIIAHQSGRIKYADMAISRWLAVGLDDDGDHLPSGVFLRPVSVEATEWRSGEKPLALGKRSIVNEDDVMGQDHRKKPWSHVAETVMQDLVSSFKALRSEIKDQSMNEIKPTLIAKFGKILFRGSQWTETWFKERSPSFPVETCRDMVTKTSLKRLKRSFYSNLPSSYMENVTRKVIPEIGLSFEDEKDIYLVKLCDESRPGVTICCKCSVIKAEQRLEPYKVELDQMRYMVVDVSCLNKDLDMRLMLRAKRLFTAISESEKNSIRDLITSAILDSSVKGGLRWPPRKAFCGDRYEVIGAWHTISSNYKNSFMRLKVKHADRFDFRGSHGEVTEEITLKLNGITSELHGQCVGADSICDMLKDAVKMVWEHLLSCGDTVI